MSNAHLIDPEPVEKQIEVEAQQKIATVFDKKLLVKGILWFALITVATIAGIFFYNNTGNTVEALSAISPKYIALCLGMLFVDLMLGCWRNHIYVRKLAPGVPQWVSFRANVANMFVGAVTPAHGGATPAQVYVYNSNGVPITSAFAISLINGAATMVFMPLAGFVAIMVMDTSSLSGMMPAMLKSGFTFFLGFLLAFLLAFFRPQWAGVIIKYVARVLSRVIPKREAKLTQWAETSYQKISKYQQTCNIILKGHPYLFPLSMVFTTVLYMNKYCMQYVILLGLGVDASLTQVISIQILIQFMIYFAPSPGGSGFAEVSISVLFAKIVPSSLLSIFTLLQRSFLLFFPSVLGAYVVISLLRRQALGKK